MELRGLDRRRRHRLRQADPAVRHAPQDGRPHGRRLDRHQSAGQGRDQQHAVVHQVGVLLRGVRSVLPPEHPEQRRRVPRDRGDLPARHHRQRRAAGRLRRARADRLPHGRLHVRRARHDAARQGARRRATAATPASRSAATTTAASRSSMSTSPAAPGAGGPGPTASTATRTCSRTWRRSRSR